jgi:hypothetical protein
MLIMGRLNLDTPLYFFFFVAFNGENGLRSESELVCDLYKNNSRLVKIFFEKERKRT